MVAKNIDVAFRMRNCRPSEQWMLVDLISEMHFFLISLSFVLTFKLMCVCFSSWMH